MNILPSGRGFGLSKPPSCISSKEKDTLWTCRQSEEAAEGNTSHTRRNTNRTNCTQVLVDKGTSSVGRRGKHSTALFCKIMSLQQLHKQSAPSFISGYITPVSLKKTLLMLGKRYSHILHAIKGEWVTKYNDIFQIAAWISFLFVYYDFVLIYSSRCPKGNKRIFNGGFKVLQLIFTLPLYIYPAMYGDMGFLQKTDNYEAGKLSWY